MTYRIRAATAAIASVLALALSSCSMPAPGASSDSAAGGAASSAPQSATPPTPEPVSPTVALSPGATQLATLPDDRTSKSKPFEARGVPLISRKHPISKGYTPKLDSRYRLVPEAAKAYGRMVAAAKKAGLTIAWRVGYRSYATQAALYASPPAVYGDAASQYVAKPGCSEHQAGLAVDVGSPKGRGSRFPRTKEYTWMRAHAYEYGFILRYPKGKTALTGYNYESWHYRYVGTEVAAAFGPNSDLTLEEYLGGR